ncbi:M23 family metallopeptidase [Paenibacillus sediminis]|uniref:Stage IV sporulation protein FA n=1 Tax=Paenibacillus sediminis TaxID=664909 RepID=A0ABS4H725_9BACL|nr:M23 family metallopeptidase [Paenibacillus sediminis]MBP1938325.1 stage IV sporulation protein FA [Paenibacillus sediminis]
MDIKSNIKQRRERRIEQLLTEEQSNSRFARFDQPRLNQESMNTKMLPTVSRGVLHNDYEELDPEVLWKRERGKWNEQGGSDAHQPPSFIKSFLLRTLISAIIFGLLWSMNDINSPWSVRVKAFVLQALTQEMNFEQIEVWYEEHFGGAPTFISIFNGDDRNATKVNGTSSFVSPLSGTIVQSFDENLRGIEIAPTQQSAVTRVKSIETGRVLEVSHAAQAGETVRIQHPDGYVSIYSNLSKSVVQVNDWVEGGDIIGELAEVSSPDKQTTLFLAILKDEQYIDPAEVIPFD